MYRVFHVIIFISIFPLACMGQESLSPEILQELERCLYLVDSSYTARGWSVSNRAQYRELDSLGCLQSIINKEAIAKRRRDSDSLKMYSLESYIIRLNDKATSLSNIFFREEWHVADHLAITVGASSARSIKKDLEQNRSTLEDSTSRFERLLEMSELLCLTTKALRDGRDTQDFELLRLAEIYYSRFVELDEELSQLFQKQ